MSETTQKLWGRPINDEDRKLADAKIKTILRAIEDPNTKPATLEAEIRAALYVPQEKEQQVWGSKEYKAVIEIANGLKERAPEEKQSFLDKLYVALMNLFDTFGLLSKENQAKYTKDKKHWQESLKNEHQALLKKGREM